MNKIAIYARVSKANENERYSFENQIKWCEKQVEKNSNWRMVEKYFDEGITGTQTKQRTGFNKMIEDAKKKKFDIIVTREVSRFARNILDALNYAEHLKNLGIEVIFVDDQIKTFDIGAFEKLAFMAISAEKESRKISERIRTGLEIARDKRVLLGSGNILGYERIGKTFKINEEQAETVRLIFDCYLKGYGLRKIKSKLIKEKRLNSQNKVRWYESTLSKMLGNPMYIGKQYQNQTSKKDFKSSKVTYNKKKDYILIEPRDEDKFEPIISDEIFNEVQRVRKKRYNIDRNGKLHGLKASEEKWAKILECGCCGSKFKQCKYTYNENTDNYERQYACGNRKNNGKKVMNFEGNKLIECGCNQKTLLSWQLELMIKDILDSHWKYKNDSMKEILSLIDLNYVNDRSDGCIELDRIVNKLKKTEARKKRTITIFAEGCIDDKEFKEKVLEYNNEIKKLNEKIESIKNGTNNFDVAKKDKLLEIEKRLNEFEETGNNSFVAKDLIDGLVDKIIVKDTEFKWFLNLSKDDDNPFESESRELEKKKKHSLKIAKTYYKKLYESTIGVDTARKYRKEQGTYIRTDKWRDIKFEVYVR